MKKVLLTTLVASLVGGAAFAYSAPAPVTNFDSTTGTLQVGYGLITSGGDTMHAFQATVQAGLNDQFAGEYSYSNLNVYGTDLGMHTLTGYYRMNDQFNAYASLCSVSGQRSYQVGVVGYMPLGNSMEGFARVGFGNHILQSEIQVGVKYPVTDTWTAQAYVEHMGTQGGNANGLYVGAGYKF